MEREKQLEYNRPWILQRADPYVYRHTDGWYYFTASVPAYDGICLRRAKTLAELPEAEEVEVWHKHESGIMSEHIWAPELHYLFGKWYLYFAGGEKRRCMENTTVCLGVRGRRSACGNLERAWNDETGG